ncbi:MAG: hypothetical protein KOO62_12560 [candidate division Zixibacteria bacterium]|nr:hypothetical protein [candidate division Zixibacteria bacterium]
MTERLYYHDAELVEFDATIAVIGEDEGRYYTILDRSAFYPTSGGQLFDTGELAGVAIEEVVETGDDVIRHLSSSPVGGVGQTVHGEVNRTRRKANSRKHTAQHILSQAFVKLFGWSTVSVHLGEQYAAIELDQSSVAEEQLQKSESIANEVVLANDPVQIRFLEGDELNAIPLRRIPKRSGLLRIVITGEFDYSACGGTHCRSTGEVGIIKIMGTEQMRGHVLVKFLIGQQALADYGNRLTVTSTLSQRLTCGIGDLVERVDKLSFENKELRHQLGKTQKELLPIRASALAENAVLCGKHRLVVDQVDDFDSKLTSALVIQVAAITGGAVFLITGERLFVATASESGLHAGQLARQIGVACGLKGGGNERVAQLGTVDRDSLERYRQAIEQVVTNA